MNTTNDSETLKLSIIIPVYNSEDYLEECINSIRFQSYKNIEIILIDDGSDDNSLQLCKEFQKLDSRIKVFHQRNRGAASARNIGLDEATGELITFVDSDDIIDVKLYETMIELLIKNNADLLRFQMSRNKEKYFRSEKLYESSKYTALKKINMENIGQGCVLGIYRKRLISGIRFTEGIRIGEDYEFVIKAVDKAERIIFSNYKGYFYRRNKDSVCFKGYDNDSEKYLKNYYKICKCFSNKYPLLKKEFLAYYYIQVLALPIAMVRGNKYNDRLIWICRKIVIKYLKEFIKIKKIGFYYKTSALLYSIHPKALILPYKYFITKWRDR